MAEEHREPGSETAPAEAGRGTPPEVDALGKDKRRAVIGGRYGPTPGRQLALYGSFLAVVAAVVVGFIILANELDQPPETVEAEAPWAQPEAPQSRPRGVDQVPP